MEIRLLAPALALAALAADAGSAHGLASWLVLLALPAAAGWAFVAVGDALAGEGRRMHAWTSAAAVVLLVLGSAVRHEAPVGAGPPALAVSTVVAALALYALPGLVWLLEPLRSVRALRTESPRLRAGRV
jgi:hypothetical protein